MSMLTAAKRSSDTWRICRFVSLFAEKVLIYSYDPAPADILQNDHTKKTMEQNYTELPQAEIIRRGISDIKEKFGFEITVTGEGTAESVLELQERHWNLYGMPYGGVQFNMADLTSGAAFLSAGGVGVTACGHVNFMRPASPDTKKLICRAHVEKTGRMLFVLSASVLDDAGTVLSDYTFTYAHIKQGRAGRRGTWSHATA